MTWIGRAHNPEVAGSNPAPAIEPRDRRPYNVALIVLDPDGAAAFADDRRLEDRSPAGLARDSAVIEEVASAVERANSHLSRPERVKRFRVLGTEWEAAGDELTPTLKLKRKPIEQKYAEEIEALYAEDALLSA